MELLHLNWPMFILILFAATSTLLGVTGKLGLNDDAMFYPEQAPAQAAPARAAD